MKSKKPSEFEFIDRFYIQNMCSTRKCLVCQKSLQGTKLLFCEECRPFLEEVAPALNAINPDDYPGLNLKLDIGLLLIAVEKVLPELATTFWISHLTLLEKLEQIPEYQIVCKIRAPGRVKSALGRVLKAKGWHMGSGSKTYYNQPNEQRQREATKRSGQLKEAGV